MISRRRRPSFSTTPRFRNAGFLLLGILLITAAFIAGVWGTGVAVVRGVEVEGNEIVAEEDIVAAAREAIAAPLVGPLPGNLLFLPRGRIVQRLSETFPRFAEVRVGWDFLHRTVRVNVRERVSEGIYCTAKGLVDDQTVLAPASDACFLIDRDGVIFAEAPESEGSLIFSLTDSGSGDRALGERVLAPETLVAARELWEGLRVEVRLGVRRIVLQEGNVAFAETFNGWSAIFDLAGDRKAQLIALRELLARELSPEKRGGLSYIDLRVPGRIYYQ